MRAALVAGLLAWAIPQRAAAQPSTTPTGGSILTPAAASSVTATVSGPGARGGLDLEARAPAATAPALAPPRSEYAIDPVTDSAILAASLGFGGLLELILQTGELRPQPPVDPEVLLPLDRHVAKRDAHENSAGPLGDAATGIVIAYALGDIARAALERERPDDEWLRYGVMYLESATATWAIGNLVKIAVRRPRPFAYEEVRRGEPLSDDTNSALSFYSLHTALSATLASTATYLAFVRDPTSPEPWITAAVGASLTTFVGIQRVRAHAHFPTDVIAGGMAGIGIGLLVPHLHRVASGSAYIALGPASSSGGTAVFVSGQF